MDDTNIQTQTAVKSLDQQEQLELNEIAALFTEMANMSIKSTRAFKNEVIHLTKQQ